MDISKYIVPDWAREFFDRKLSRKQMLEATPLKFRRGTSDPEYLIHGTRLDEILKMPDGTYAREEVCFEFMNHPGARPSKPQMGFFRTLTIESAYNGKGYLIERVTQIQSAKAFAGSNNVTRKVYHPAGRFLGQSIPSRLSIL